MRWARAHRLQLALAAVMIGLSGLVALLNHVGHLDLAITHDQKLERVKALVAAASRGTSHVESLLPGTVAGLSPAVVSANGHPFIAWVSPDFKAILVGALFDREGQNLTAQTMDGVLQHTGEARPAALTPPSDPAPPPAEGITPTSAALANEKELLAVAAQAGGIKSGWRGPTVHAFVDLNCEFCAMLHGQLAPFIRDGRLIVHWIPVAILAQSSRTLAAAVLQSSNPLATFDQHEQQRSRGGPGVEGKSVLENTAQILDSNTRLLRIVNEGMPATPVLLYKMRDGRAIHLAGALQAVDRFIAGLPSE